MTLVKWKYKSKNKTERLKIYIGIWWNEEHCEGDGEGMNIYILQFCYWKKGCGWLEMGNSQKYQSLNKHVFEYIWL